MEKTGDWPLLRQREPTRGITRKWEHRLTSGSDSLELDITRSQRFVSMSVCQFVSLSFGKSFRSSVFHFIDEFNTKKIE